MGKKIIHIDMDAFYASVEQRDNPDLKGKPIIVGGTPKQRGVVSTASYEARKYGIRSAMATSLALKLCPDLIIVQPNFDKYHKISRQLYSFYKEYTDIIEPLSLDECYLDVTVNKKNIKTATEIANLLRNKIKTDLHLTASVGVAPNKLIAKIASDLNKPDGMVVIKPHMVNEFIKNLDVKRIWGVGKVAYKKLESMNIKICMELQKLTIVELIDHFGKFGETLYYFCRGIDNRPVETYREIKSIGAETTFMKDIDNINIIKQGLYNQALRVVNRLKNNNIKGKTITIKLKYADFNLITRSITIDEYLDDINIIYNYCCKLLNKTNVSSKKVRLVGVSVTNFNNMNDRGQLNLL